MRREFLYLPKYTGEHVKYDDWKFKVKTFLNEDIEYVELLTKLDEETEIPTNERAQEIIDEVNWKFNVAEKDLKWLNHQLYQLLCTNLEDKALKAVKNIGKQSDTNGIIGWCKLMLDVSSTTKEGIQGMSEKVYKPKRVKNYTDINSAIEDWETNAEIFSKTEGKSVRQHEDICIKANSPRAT